VRLLTFFTLAIIPFSSIFTPQPLYSFETGGTWVHHERQAPQIDKKDAYDSGIRTIFPLSTGSIWVDTKHAYHVFDGVRWKKYSYDTTRFGSMKPFLGTREGKFFFYQDATIYVWNLSDPASEHKSFSTGIEITPMRGALAPDGSVYIGSGNSVNGGIFRFNENGLVRLRKGQTNSLAVDHEGHLWATHRDTTSVPYYQLLMYDGSTWTDFTPNNNKSLYSIVTVAPDSSIWYNNEGIHDVYRNGVWEHYNQFGPRYISFDTNGSVWGIQQNFLYHRNTDGTWNKVYTYATSPDASEYFMTSLPDSGNYIFSGTNLLINRPGSPPTSWEVVPDFYDLGSDKITCMVYMDDGTLVCGHSQPDLLMKPENIENAGISIYDGTTWRNYTSALINGVKYTFNNIFAISNLPFGDIIFSSDSGYNTTFSGSSWGIIDSLTYGLPNQIQNVYDYLAIDSNTLYAATNEGMFRYTYKGLPTHFNGPTYSLITYNKLLKLLIDSKNNLYVQTNDSQIYTFDIKNSKWDIPPLYPKNDNLRDYIVVESTGDPWLWVACGNYLYKRYNGQEEKVSSADSLDNPLYLENASMLAIGGDDLIYASGFNNTGYFDKNQYWHRIPELNSMQSTVAAFFGEEKMALNSLVITGNTSLHSGLYTYDMNGTSVENEKPVSSFPLLINHPNPFNETTAITFELPATEKVRIDIYSVTGQLVRHLVDNHFGPGINTVHWDSRSDSNEHVSSGLYLYRVTAGKRTAAGKMLLLR
jgi:hypothetical protein